jgi:outer membrane protein
LRSELGRAKYKNGLLNFEDWNAIESDLINRQKAKLQSQRDRVVAEAAWEQATGKGVIP